MTFAQALARIEVTDEGLEDALLDVIGYSMIMLGELKELSND